ARASVIRYGFIVAGLIGAITLVVMFSHEQIQGEYIERTSFDPNTRTLAVMGSTKATTYVVAPNIAVTLDKKSADIDALHGRYSVLSKAQGTRGELMSLDLGDIPRQLGLDQTRSFLLGAVTVEFAVILLIITNAAASTVTREKEDGSLDLLLTTPITSRYYIWGKLRGLVSYVLPLVAVPVLSVMIFIFYDILRFMQSHDQASQWVVFPEAILILPGLLIIIAAFASIVGMQMSLRCRTTVRAVMSSVGIMLGAC